MTEQMIIINLTLRYVQLSVTFILRIILLIINEASEPPGRSFHNGRTLEVQTIRNIHKYSKFLAFEPAFLATQ